VEFDMNAAWLNVGEMTDAIAGAYYFEGGGVNWINRIEARAIALRIDEASKKKAENADQRT